MASRRAAPWPPESRQIVADYIDLVRGQDTSRRWQPDLPPAPCSVCGGARWYGQLCCGTVTPPARPSAVPGAGGLSWGG